MEKYEKLVNDIFSKYSINERIKEIKHRTYKKDFRQTLIVKTNKSRYIIKFFKSSAKNCIKNILFIHSLLKREGFMLNHLKKNIEGRAVSRKKGNFILVFKLVDNTRKLLYEKQDLKRASRFLANFHEKTRLNEEIEVALISRGQDHYKWLEKSKHTTIPKTKTFFEYVSKLKNSKNLPAALIHGDFGIYNLRRYKDDLVVFDFEDAKKSLRVEDLAFLTVNSIKKSGHIHHKDIYKKIIEPLVSTYNFSTSTKLNYQELKYFLIFCLEICLFLLSKKIKFEEIDESPKRYESILNIFNYFSRYLYSLEENLSKYVINNNSSFYK